MKQLLQAILNDGLALGDILLIGHKDRVRTGRADARDTHGRGVGHKNAVVAAALLIGGVVDLGFQHAHNGVPLSADLDALANGVAAIAHPADVIAYNADLFVGVHVHVVQGTALHDGVASHVQIHFADAFDGGAAVTVIVRTDFDCSAHTDGGRNSPEDIRVFFHQFIEVLDFDRTGAVAHDLHGQEVGAHIGKLVLDAGGHTVAQTHNDHNSHHANDDAQHGKECTEFIAPDVLDGFTEGFVDHTLPSCLVSFCGFTGSGMTRLGWTTASGAWASPS